MAYSITDKCIGCGACRTICPCGAVNGEKKHRHTIDRTLCIECGACGRVCPSGAIEDPFGLTVQRQPKKEWEQPVFDPDLCMSCGMCLDTCPVNALDAGRYKVGSRHLFPWLSRETRCMGCGFCAQDCPVGAITMVVRETV